MARTGEAKHWIPSPTLLPGYTKPGNARREACVRACAGMADPINEIAVLRAESNDEARLRERMAGILTAVANALKGEPAPLSSHSWHDLPQMAALTVANEARLIAEVENLRKALTAALARKEPTA